MTEQQQTDGELAAIAYGAYREHSLGVSLVSGDLLPGWDQVPQSIRAAWTMAAAAVRMAVEDDCAFKR